MSHVRVFPMPVLSNVASQQGIAMFGWWKKAGPDASNELPSERSDGTLNSIFPPNAAGEVHPSLGKFTRLQLKTESKRNQCSLVLGTSLGTTEVTTESTTVPATDC